MSAHSVEKIADAVLYEGYLLYPYRPSAVKNRQRWNFGLVYPRAYSEMAGGVEPCEMETQCLALGGPASVLATKVRCLRLVERLGESWQEAAECEMSLPDVRFAELEASPARRQFSFPATRTVAGEVVRTQEPLQCSVETSLEKIGAGLVRIAVRISNQTPFTVRPDDRRERVLASSLLSAHTILRVSDGEFVSLLEPPPQFQEAAAACRNTGTWPVLAGEPGALDTMLSSPIILYDYPQVAPESPGDLFDGAEIDEILSLRILTLTDEEKDALRRGDERARQILERTETLPPEHFMKLHGALRSPRPAEREAS